MALNTPWNSGRTKQTTGTPGDRTPMHSFNVEISPAAGAPSTIGGVTKVSGIELETDRHDYRDGSQLIMSTSAGLHKTGVLVLERLWQHGTEWHEIRKTVLQGKFQVGGTISVVFKNNVGPKGQGNEVGRLNFTEVWPIKHTMPDLDSKASGHKTETLEFSFNDINWVLK